MAESIESVMTRDPVCLDADTALVEAAKAIDEQGIGDVLVMQDSELCGIVTDRDIAIRAVARGADPTRTRLGDICSRELVARLVSALAVPKATMNDSTAAFETRSKSSEPISGSVERSRPTITPTKALTATSSENWAAFSRSPSSTRRAFIAAR